MYLFPRSGIIYEVVEFPLVNKGITAGPLVVVSNVSFFLKLGVEGLLLLLESVVAVGVLGPGAIHCDVYDTIKV